MKCSNKKETGIFANYVQEHLNGMSLRYSKSYVIKSGRHIRAFEKYCSMQGITGVKGVTAVECLGWARSLSNKIPPHKCAPSGITLTLKYIAVKSFLSYLCGIGVLLKNPWPESLKIKEKDYMPRHVPSLLDIDILSFRLEQYSWYPLRDKAILELLYGSGLRRAEVHRLNVYDLTGNSLIVLGKGSKEREVPISRVALRALREYLKWERMEMLENAKVSLQEPALFVGRFGKRLGLEWYSYLFHKVTRNPKYSNHSEEDPIPVEKSLRKITLHGLRHACATHMLQKGASTVVLQKLLGHAKLSSTQIYTRVVVDDLKGMLSRCHPRG